MQKLSDKQLEKVSGGTKFYDMKFRDGPKRQIEYLPEEIAFMEGIGYRLYNLTFFNEKEGYLFLPQVFDKLNGMPGWEGLVVFAEKRLEKLGKLTKEEYAQILGVPVEKISFASYKY